MKRILLLIVAIAGLSILATATPGCQNMTPDQRDALIAELTAKYKATTQAAASAQEGLAAAQVQIEAQKKTLTTQPGNEDAIKLLDKAETAAKIAADNLAKLQTQAEAIGKVLQPVVTGQAPDTSGLAVFGPYGSLAGIAISLGWGVYKSIQTSKRDTAIIELAGDTKVSHTDTPFSAPTAAILGKLGVDTPGTAAAQQAPTVSSVPQL